MNFSNNLPFTDSDGDRMTFTDGKRALNSSIGSFTSLDPMLIFKKKLVIGTDSTLYRLNQEVMNGTNVAIHYSDCGIDRRLKDGLKTPPSIRSDANYVEALNIRGQVVVWGCAFDDIRFNPEIAPATIAKAVVEALSGVGEQLARQDCSLWFITIPEIGDFLQEAMSFNTVIREAFYQGRLEGINVFDYALAIKDRPSAANNFQEQLFLFLSFFDQTQPFDVLRPGYGNSFQPIAPPKYNLKNGTTKGSSSPIQSGPTLADQLRNLKTGSIQSPARGNSAASPVFSRNMGSSLPIQSGPTLADQLRNLSHMKQNRSQGNEETSAPAARRFEPFEASSSSTSSTAGPSPLPQPLAPSIARTSVVPKKDIKAALQDILSDDDSD